MILWQGLEIYLIPKYLMTFIGKIFSTALKTVILAPMVSAHAIKDVHIEVKNVLCGMILAIMDNANVMTNICEQ